MVFFSSHRWRTLSLKKLTVPTSRSSFRPMYLKRGWRRPKEATWSTHCPLSTHPTPPPTAPSWLRWTLTWTACSSEATASVTQPWRRYLHMRSLRVSQEEKNIKGRNMMLYCCLSKLCDGDIVFFHRRSSFNWLENTSTTRILLCPSQKPFLTRDLWIVFLQTRVMVMGTTSVSSTPFLYFVCISIFVTADLVRYDEESCCQK